MAFCRASREVSCRVALMSRFLQQTNGSKNLLQLHTAFNDNILPFYTMDASPLPEDEMSEEIYKVVQTQQ